MKTLVVYYSRTGHVRELAKKVAAALGADTDEIIDRDDRNRRGGYLRSVYQRIRGRSANIEPALKSPGGYDFVVVGTPVWVGSMSTPVRAYLEAHARELSKVAFFCTLGGSGAATTFRKMEKLSGKTPVATLAIVERKLGDGSTQAEIAAFTARISSPALVPA